MNMKAHTIKWVVLFLFIVGVLVMYYSLGLRIIMEHGIQFISFSAVALLIYFFISDVIFQFITKPILLKYKKLACILSTFIIVSVSVFIYVINYKATKVVHMKEQTMYILPKSNEKR
jgi:hypothetical protein